MNNGTIENLSHKKSKRAIYPVTIENAVMDENDNKVIVNLKENLYKGYPVTESTQVQAELDYAKTVINNNTTNVINQINTYSNTIESKNPYTKDDGIKKSVYQILKDNPDIIQSIIEEVKNNE